MGRLPTRHRHWRRVVPRAPPVNSKDRGWRDLLLLLFLLPAVASTVTCKQTKHTQTAANTKATRISLFSGLLQSRVRSSPSDDCQRGRRRGSPWMVAGPSSLFPFFFFQRWPSVTTCKTNPKATNTKSINSLLQISAHVLLHGWTAPGGVVVGDAGRGEAGWP